MVILLTGPSASGKSTLRDAFYKSRNIKSISAVTTRPAREDNVEIHKTISQDQFKRMEKNNELCLVSITHGYYYGYLKADLFNVAGLSLVEVDSNTAIFQQDIFKAKIVRVIPSKKFKAILIIIKKRRCNLNRIVDLILQTQKNFLKKRQRSGDLLFYNDFTNYSKLQFIELIGSIIKS